MTVLADFQIRALCEAGMVTPFDPALINPASLDLRLGDNILIESAEGPDMIPFSLAGYTEEHGERLARAVLEVGRGRRSRCRRCRKPI